MFWYDFLSLPCVEFHRTNQVLFPLIEYQILGKCFFNFMPGSSNGTKTFIYCIQNNLCKSLPHRTFSIFSCCFLLYFSTFSCLLILQLHSVINLKFSSDIHRFVGSDFLHICLFEWKFHCFPVHLISYYSSFQISLQSP